MRVVEAAYPDGMRYSLQSGEGCSLHVIFISDRAVSFEEDPTPDIIAFDTGPENMVILANEYING